MLLSFLVLVCCVLEADAKPHYRDGDVQNGRDGEGETAVNAAPKRYPRLIPEDPGMQFRITKSIKVAEGNRITGIRMDGREDAFWKTCETRTLSNIVYGEGDVRATFRVCYDRDRIYFFVAVTDKTPNNSGDVPTRQDGIELFLNENGDRPAKYHDGDLHFLLLRSGEYVLAAGTDEDVETIVTETEDGYDAEISIPWQSAENRRGNEIGFDLRVNDSQTPGTRDFILQWSDTSMMTHENLENIGVLALQ